MKIIRLTFSGVRSYPGTCGPIDFTGKNLVAILGDTGAGKSSILEAITAALYGKCTWASTVAALRSDGCPTMTVELDFEVDGRRWNVHRVFHETTRATQARLTGPEGTPVIDGVKLVDEEIHKILRLSLDAFKASVLLPQGDFDKLLNATDGNRTGILKSLFGVDGLNRVRQQAITAADRLTELIQRARQEDSGLSEDPRAEAENARARSAEALRRAEDLERRQSQLSDLQAAASRAQRQSEQSTRAAMALAQRRVLDHSTTTCTIRAAQDELQQLRESVAAEHASVRADLEAASAAQEEAQTDGLSPDALAAARQVLKDLPHRLTRLAADEAALGRVLAELEAEERSIQETGTQLTDRQQDLHELRAQAQNAQERAAASHEALEELTTAARHAAESAVETGRRRGARVTVQERLHALVQAPPDLSADRAEADLQDAQAALVRAQRAEAAHTAGIDLAAGDSCPVCTQTLPDHYRAPQPQNGSALAAAQAAVDDARKALIAAREACTRHQNEVQQLKDRLSELTRLEETGSDLQQEALAQVRKKARTVAEQSGHSEPARYAKALEHEVSAALSTLAESGQATVVERDEVVGKLLKDARDRIAQQREAAVGTAAELSTAEATLAADRSALEARTHAFGKKQKQARADEEQLETDRAHLLGDSLTELPTSIRAHLPDDGSSPTAEQIDAASQAVSHERERQTKLAERTERLRQQSRALDLRLTELANRMLDEVDRPLQHLQMELQRWADSVAEAADLMPDEQRIPLPAPVHVGDLADTERYAAALDTTSDLLTTALNAQVTAAGQVMKELVGELAAQAAAIGSAYPDEGLLPYSTGADPLAPILLSGLSRQIGALRNQAEVARREEEIALSQIPRKEQLGQAINAGERQLGAWKAVIAHLTDGKFLNHLTDLRTRSLLANGSEVLRKLSGGQLGFAENFDIVNLTTHSRRHSKTLSGGETFQASLALSLALMEMHGRSGTRLESLFLDEGFGTLDSTALDSALQVLREYVGPGKLLAVISHLRPVAEAVDDVLWVTKDHTGSKARWLAPADRDNLVREDLHGLADLT
jgi:exonuclease SbcC